MYKYNFIFNCGNLSKKGISNGA